MQWQELVKEVDRIRETEQIRREEVELKSVRKLEGIVSSARSSPSCSLCGQQGHRDFQCDISVGKDLGK